MNKQKKQTIILLIFLVVIAGAYFLITSLAKNESEEAGETTPTEKVNDIPQDDIIGITFEGTEGELNFYRDNAESAWVLEGYEGRTVTDLYINGAISTCCGFSIVQKLEGIGDFDKFGFNNPSKTVVIKTSGEVHTITFGMYNQSSSVYYVMVDDDKTVYVYSHSETLPYNNAAEYFLEDEVETGTEVEVETGTEVDAEAGVEE